MQTVYLNGDIAKFGSTWNVNCATVPEIFKLIDCQTPGFREHLIEAAESGVAYEIRRGEEFVDEDTLFLSLGKEDIIITEVPAGAKSGGAKLIIGAIILTALFFPFAGPAREVRTCRMNPQRGLTPFSLRQVDLDRLAVRLEPLDGDVLVGVRLAGR